MNFEIGKIYELYQTGQNWLVYVKVTDIYNTIEGDMIVMKRLLIKGSINFPLDYEILRKHIGYNIRARECKQADIVLELLDDE